MSEKSETKIENTAQLEAEIKKIQELFREKESEHNWQSFEAALKRLTLLTRDGAYTFENAFYSGIRALRKPILNSLASERTRLSGAACELIEELGRSLGSNFEPFVDTFIPAVLKISSRTNKLFVSRAQNCLVTIVKQCKIPAMIPKFREALEDQSKTMRTCASESILVCLEVMDVGMLAQYTTDIEWAIREGVVDSTPAVRAVSKKSFEIYKLKFDLRTQDFIDTMSQTAKKNLGIQEKNSAKGTRLPLRRFNSELIGKEISEQPVTIFGHHTTENLSIKKDQDLNQGNKKLGSQESKPWSIDIRIPPSNRDKENPMESSSPPKPIESSDSNPMSAQPSDTSFTITFDESKAATGVSTATGFAALKQPRLTSAQRANSVPLPSKSAQRMPVKTQKSSTISRSSSQKK